MFEKKINGRLVVASASVANKSAINNELAEKIAEGDCR